MNIQFDNPRHQELQDLFNELDAQEAIFYSHYDLSHHTGAPADEWKEFLTHPEVNTWLRQEIQMFKEYQLKQMIKNATDNEKSVGAAQMMNSLGKVLQESNDKEGPFIIYTHVPLTEAQKESPIEYREISENILASIPDEWSDE